MKTKNQNAIKKGSHIVMILLVKLLRTISNVGGVLEARLELTT
jgi:hypothetical protein